MSVPFPRACCIALIALSIGFAPSRTAHAQAAAIADTAMVVTDAPDPVDPGGTITWTLSATNFGGSTAAVVVVNDTLPAGLLFVSASAPAGWTCTTPPVGGTGTVQCTIPLLTAGTTDTILISASVAGVPVGGTTYTNTATIGARTGDPDGSNNSASATTTVRFIPSMTVDKVLLGTIDNDGSTTVTVGDQLDYQVTATNNGNGSLSNVVVSDDHFAATQSCGVLAIGATCVLTGSYIVTTADEAAGQVVNVGTGNSTEIGPINDNDTTLVVFTPNPVLTVTKALTGIVDNDGSTTVSQGDRLDYQVTAANGGNIPLTNVVVTDDHFAATQTCASVAVGGNCILTGSYIVTSGDTTAGQVINTGSATSNEVPVPVTDQTNTGVFFVAAPAMTLAKAAPVNADNDGSTTVSEGDVLTYTVTATNTGNVALTTLRIDDAQLSPGTTQCASVAPGGTCVLSGTHTVSHADALAHQVTNTATATSVEVPGPVTSPTVVTPVPAVAGMSVVKRLLGSVDNDGSSDVSAGDQLDYDVTANNTGTGDLTSVVVGDDHTSSTQLCGTVVPGATCRLTFSYIVTPADARAGRVVNTGNATSAEVPGPLSDSVTTAVNAPPPTLTIVSGDGQAGYGGQTTAPLVVQLLDGFGAPMAGATINWTGANQGTTVTNGSGQASNTVTFNGTTGTLDIVAAYLPAPVEVHFTLQSISAQLGIVSGDGQSGPALTTLPNPLVVQAADDGNPIGTTLSWTVNQGDATVTPTANNTDGTTGQASASVSFGPTPGPVQVTVVRTDGSGESVVFNLTSTVPLPVLSKTSGDDQAGLAATAADQPLVVTLVDGFGTPLPNATVNWSIAGPGTLSAPSTQTNAAGQAQVFLTYGPGAGSIVVTASHVGAVGPVTFNEESLAVSLGIASGDGQTGPINTTLPLPLVIAVVDPTGVEAPIGGRFGRQALDGVTVNFAVTSGGGSVTPSTATTDASGHASTQFTLGPIPGTQTVTATVAGGSSVTFTATATLVRTLVVVSGSGQGAAPGSTLPNPLVVRAQDNGADAPGIGINWSIVSGSGSVTPTASTTNASGLAQTSATLGATPGTLTIRAERVDDPTVFVTFVATTAKLQLIPGLDDETFHLAVVIDEACETLAGMTSLTPEQADFLARCQDLIDSSIIDPENTIDVLDTLKPDLAIAMAESSFLAAQSQFQNLKLRIAALRSGTQGNGFNGLALNGPQGTVSIGSLVSALTQDGDAPAKPSGEIGGDFQRWGFFASGNIGRGEAEEGRNRPAYDYDINGLTVGVDYRKSDSLIFGAALGYTRQDTELDRTDGEMDMSGWSVSGYGTWFRDNSWYTDAVITWGHNTFDLVRSIRYTLPLPGGGTSTIDQTARSNSGGSLMEAAFTFGRDFQKGGWSIGPYGRLLYTKLDFDRIEDELDSGPGSGLGLEIDSRTLTSVASEIGAKFTYAHSTDWGVVTPHFQLEWEHEFKDDPKSLTARFLADPNGTPFILSGEEIDSDYFRLSVGLSVIMAHGRSGFVLYERTVGRQDFDQQNFGLGIRLEF